MMTCVDAREKEVEEDQWMLYKVAMTCVEENERRWRRISGRASS